MDVAVRMDMQPTKVIMLYQSRPRIPRPPRLHPSDESNQTREVAKICGQP